ncbi:MAG: methylenetetrahydrofolate reductase [Chloroflexi bacterium]|jgi:methylenetetrahydrofolate reductase (NADPH)|nr:methylenetetrahydrofolate reductase [Chloroflexota bacterium]MBT7081645.1 methylenetetrahydrofolate reductase [Chloroflexota bacterium]MBT7289318.1 methylenetetrahydrofolate reductase [Chloroflexota bacterium]
MASKFKQALNSGKFVVTTEVGPAKGTNMDAMLHHIDLLKDVVDAINVTDNQSSVMRFPSVGGCMLVKQKGAEPILQMTCRDRNRMALQADLLYANYMGIENVLCLTGDAIPVGDHKEAKSVFDLDSVQLLKTVRTLESGKDLGGNDLDGVPSYCAGAIVTPEANPIEPQLVKFEKKVNEGAEFFQTQAIYDLDNFKKFMKHARKYDTKILAGIVLLSSAGMARYMTKNIPGIFVPQDLIDEMAGAPKGQALKTGIEIAGRLIGELKKEAICDGVHIMAIGKEEVVPDILAAAGM